VSGFRSVQVGCSRFIRRCHLISVLCFSLRREVWAQELVAVAFCLLRNGSYTSPLIHSRSSSTASFRATATTASFLGVFPSSRRELPPPATQAKTAEVFLNLVEWTLTLLK
jgi:hypothetical protein